MLTTALGTFRALFTLCSDAARADRAKNEGARPQKADARERRAGRPGRAALLMYAATAVVPAAIAGERRHLE